MLSIILPAYKEPLLAKTIEDLLVKAKGDIEIIAVLDGYWINDPVEDDRVHYLHLGEKTGMRNAINVGVALAKGDRIMKADAHCVFGEGFDQMPVAYSEVVIPRRYFLDSEKWEVMKEEGYVDYEKLTIHKTRDKFHGETWKSRTKERASVERDETMVFQGSMWMMTRKWWDDVVGPLDDVNYGPFIQEPVEIAMKTWSNGGKLLVDKRYWYAHKHRKFNRSHNIPREEADAGSAYALKVWGDEYEKLKERFGLKEQTVRNEEKKFTKYEKYGAYHWGQYEKGGKYRRHVDRVVDKLKEYDSVLDVGAGDGLITSMLGAKGIDNEPSAVECAKEKGVDVELGDAYNLPFKDNSFDAVFLGDVIEHVDNPEKVIAEAYRVARKKVLITTPPRGMQHDPFHVREWLEDELRGWLEELKYTLCCTEQVDEDKEIYAMIDKDINKDLTVIYLSAEKLPKKWREYQLQKLESVINGAHLITVTRTPLEGHNLIDSEETGYINIYRQILRAAKEATTEYLAIAEDDTLYSEEHFSYRPKGIGYNMNRWALFSWGEPVFSMRDRVSNCSLIGKRDVVIEALEERFEKYPGNSIPLEKVGEMGRNKLEKALGLREWKAELFYTNTSIVQINHVWAHEDRQKRKRKSYGKVRAYSIPFFGDAKDIQDTFNNLIKE